MIEEIIGFLKVFFGKIWFWLVMAIVAIGALFSVELFHWLGFNEDRRWIVGLVALVSISLSIQHCCDWIKEYFCRRNIIRNIDNLPKESFEILKHIVRDKKKTLKIRDHNGLDQHRIIAHFELKKSGNYVTFPDFLWKELVKRFDKSK